jgi:hypothetical protein
LANGDAASSRTEVEAGIGILSRVGEAELIALAEQQERWLQQASERQAAAPEQTEQNGEN